MPLSPSMLRRSSMTLRPGVTRRPSEARQEFTVPPRSPGRRPGVGVAVVNSERKAFVLDRYSRNVVASPPICGRRARGYGDAAGGDDSWWVPSGAISSMPWLPANHTPFDLTRRAHRPGSGRLPPPRGTVRSARTPLFVGTVTVWPSSGCAVMSAACRSKSRKTTGSPGRHQFFIWPKTCRASAILDMALPPLRTEISSEVGDYGVGSTRQSCLRAVAVEAEDEAEVASLPALTPAWSKSITTRRTGRTPRRLAVSVRTAGSGLGRS